jgi:hypothetical protein
MWRLLILSVFLISCGHIRPIPVPIPKDSSSCAAACANLQKLGCEEGKPLEDGTTCEKFCVDTQKAGHDLNPKCLVTVEECYEVEACMEED